MSYLGTAINNSPTIPGAAGADIQNGAFLAVAYDTNGDFVTAGAGANAMGLLIAETPESVKGKDSITVQVKDIGAWRAGAALAAGNELACDANGMAVPAASGDYIFAQALQKADPQQVIPVQIIKAGYKA